LGESPGSDPESNFGGLSSAQDAQVGEEDWFIFALLANHYAFSIKATVVISHISCFLLSLVLPEGSLGIKTLSCRLGTVPQASNSNYSEARSEDCGSRPVHAKNLQDPP
jgi:hypothetical protein